jgi:hypothetical protein
MLNLDETDAMCCHRASPEITIIPDHNVRAFIFTSLELEYMKHRVYTSSCFLTRKLLVVRIHVSRDAACSDVGFLRSGWSEGWGF